MKQSKHRIQRIAVVETRFKGTNQSTHDVVVLIALFGPTLGSSSTSSPAMDGEIFYPLNFLTGEPFLNKRLVKIAETVSGFIKKKFLFSLETLEPILARIKLALGVQKVTLLARRQACVFFAHSSNKPAFPDKGFASNLDPGETFPNYADVPTPFASRTPKLQHSETSHEINTPKAPKSYSGRHPTETTPDGHVLQILPVLTLAFLLALSK